MAGLVGRAITTSSLIRPSGRRSGKNLKKGDYRKSAGEQVTRKKSELGRVDADGKAKAVAALSEALDGKSAPLASI